MAKLDVITKASRGRYGRFEPRLKYAALGGDGSDVPFEQAFSNLAHALIRDKSPSLMDYELGFQLLDRSDDSTKAVGAMGFKVGSLELLVPVFFLNGQLKGHEMLYIVNHDLRVPLKENWLQYILNRKPRIVGSGVGRDLSQLGIVHPDLTRLSRSPYKWASAAPAWVRHFAPAFAHSVGPTFEEAATRAVQDLRWFHDKLSLGRLTKEASQPMLQWLVDCFRKHPALAQQYEKFYGLATLKQAVVDAKRRASQISLDAVARRKIASVLTDKTDPSKDPEKRGDLQIITYHAVISTSRPAGLSADELEKLKKDKLLVRDLRSGDEVSIPYMVSARQRLTNPSETGLYWVLTDAAGSDFAKCFVAFFDDRHTDANGTRCAVIRLDADRRDVLITRPERVWCAVSPDDTEFREWLNRLPDASTLADVEHDSRHRYMLISPSGKSATPPFTIESTIGDENGSTTYRLYIYNSLTDDGLEAPCVASRSSDYVGPTRFLHLTGLKGSRILYNYPDIWAPAGSKLLALATGDARTMRSGPLRCIDLASLGRQSASPLMTKGADDQIPGGNADNQPDAAFDKEQLAEGARHEREHTDDPALAKEIAKDHLIDDKDYYKKLDKMEKESRLILGKPEHLELDLMAKLGKLKIYNDGCECVINSRRMPLMDGLIHLIRDHGFRESTARELLKKANLSSSHTLCCRVKYAAPYLTNQGPLAPSFPPPQETGDNFMGVTGPVVGPTVQATPVTPLMASMTDPQTYNPSPEFTPPPYPGNQPVGAGSSGQEDAPKELFDASMLSSALRTVRDDMLVDRWLPDLMTGMDRIARILLAFYWHGDKFRERFGAQDMPELEDALRNSFEILGDLVLFLKQRTVQPYPEEEAASLSLQDARK